MQIGRQIRRSPTAGTPCEENRRPHRAPSDLRALGGAPAPRAGNRTIAGLRRETAPDLFAAQRMAMGPRLAHVLRTRDACRSSPGHHAIRLRPQHSSCSPPRGRPRVRRFEGRREARRRGASGHGRTVRGGALSVRVAPPRGPGGDGQAVYGRSRRDGCPTRDSGGRDVQPHVLFHRQGTTARRDLRSREAVRGRPQQGRQDRQAENKPGVRPAAARSTPTRRSSTASVDFVAAMGAPSRRSARSWWPSPSLPARA